MDVKQKRKIGQTPLYLAFKHACYVTVKYIIDLIYSKQKWTTKTVADELITLHTTKNGWAVLHIACSNGQTEVVKLLIGFDMNVNDKTNYGSTPVYLACKKGHFDTVKFLLDLSDQTLDSCVDTTATTHYGWTVCSKGHTEVVELLIVLVSM